MKGPDWTRVLIGFAVFLGLGALGAWAAGRLDPTGILTLRGPATAVSPVVLMLGVSLVVLDMALGGLRLHLWIRALAPGVAYGVSVRTYVVNLFASAVSPMGSASAPAQVAVLAKYGVPPARAVAALLVNFIGLLTAFLVLGSLSGLYLAGATGVGTGTASLVKALVLVLGGALGLMVVVLGNPRLGSTLAERLTSAGITRPGRSGRLLQRLGGALERGVADYRAALTVGAVVAVRVFSDVSLDRTGPGASGATPPSPGSAG